MTLNIADKVACHLQIMAQTYSLLASRYRDTGWHGDAVVMQISAARYSYEARRFMGLEAAE